MFENKISISEEEYQRLLSVDKANDELIRTNQLLLQHNVIRYDYFTNGMVNLLLNKNRQLLVEIESLKQSEKHSDIIETSLLRSDITMLQYEKMIKGFAIDDLNKEIEKLKRMSLFEFWRWKNGK